MNVTTNTFAMRDESVRPGGSPTDALVSITNMSLVVGDNKVSTPYKKGSEVGYVVLNKATVDVDGNVTIPATVASDSFIYVIGRNMNQTVGGKAF